MFWCLISYFIIFQKGQWVQFGKSITQWCVFFLKKKAMWSAKVLTVFFAVFSLFSEKKKSKLQASAVVGSLRFGAALTRSLQLSQTHGHATNPCSFAPPFSAGLHSIMNALETIPWLQMAASGVASSIPTSCLSCMSQQKHDGEMAKIYNRPALALLITEQDTAERGPLMFRLTAIITIRLDSAWYSQDPSIGPGC